MLKSLSKIMGKNTDSPIEEVIYQDLLFFGLKAVPQYKVGVFYIDLAFPEIKLATEADGKDYHSSDSQKERDAYRQKRLEDLGWKFERFTGNFLYKYEGLAGAKIALKYFKDKLSKEQDLIAKGRVVNYFMKKDKDSALQLTNAFLDGKEFIEVESSLDNLQKTNQKYAN